MDSPSENVQPNAPGGPIDPEPAAEQRRAMEGLPAMILSDRSRMGEYGQRDVLPATRRSITHKFTIGNHEGYLTIGLHDDGRPGEVFIKMSKEGSTISGLCQAFCRALSLAIQHGLSLPDAVARFKGMRFEPMGATSNAEIPEASSIVDYVARYLEQEFLKESA